MAKTSKHESYTPLKKGYDPRDDGTEENSVAWLKLDINSYVDVTVLVDVDDIIATEQCAIWLEADDRAAGMRSPVWVYVGRDDPSHDLEVTKTYRAFLPVLHEGEVKVWPMGKMAHRQLLDVADAGGDLAGLDIRIKRTGGGKATRYSVASRGTRTKISHIEEVDVPSMLGPLTVEGVRELIAERLKKKDYDEVLRAYRGNMAVKREGTKPKKAKEEEEDEDLDSVKLI
jgi:hypothetical protein